MEIIINLILFMFGLWVLTKSSNFLVEGASSIASKLKVKPIVIGLTMVAFGTSAPEMVVSVSSSASGYSDIALGNVVGSNIFNILVILGVSAVINSIHIKKNTFWKEIPFSLISALILLFFTIDYWLKISTGAVLNLNSTSVIGSLTLGNGLVLMSIFAIFMYYTFGMAKSGEVKDVEIKEIGLWKSIFMVILGLSGLTLSAKFLVTEPAVFIAKAIGFSETLIGLTIVSIGTGLPELATSISASFKKNSEIVVGNVVGSNLFNILFVLAVTVLIKPIPITGQNIFDIFFLIFANILLFVLVFLLQRFKLNKLEGSIMLVIYIFYLTYLMIR